MRPSDYQLSDALPKLADLAQGGGSEQDIQRRIIDNLLEITSAQLRPRICGSRDNVGLRVDEQLELEARIATAARELAKVGSLPPVGDDAWGEEMQREVELVLDVVADRARPS